MCIVQGGVSYEVSKTNIFVCPVKENRQLTAYSNEVKQGQGFFSSLLGGVEGNSGLF